MVSALDFLTLCRGKYLTIERRLLTGEWRLVFLYELLYGLPLARWLVMICARVFPVQIRTIFYFYVFFFLFDNSFPTGYYGCDL
jgi:hypothetical protein